MSMMIQLQSEDFSTKHLVKMSFRNAERENMSISFLQFLRKILPVVTYHWELFILSTFMLKFTHICHLKNLNFFEYCPLRE